MLNSDFLNNQAELMAKRLEQEYPEDLDAQLQRALELTLCRPANPVDMNQLRGLIEELETEEGLDRHAALESACLLMLNLNEFMHVR